MDIDLDLQKVSKNLIAGIENTVGLAKQSINKGMIIIEGDIHKTKDSKLVMIHDGDFKRIAGKDINVADLNYDDLPNFQENILIHFAENEYYSNKNNSVHKPDLFEDFLKEFQDKEVYFVIEVKTACENDLKAALKMIKKYNMEDKVCIGITAKNLTSFKKENEFFISYMGIKSLLVIYAAFLLGIRYNF